MSDFSCDNCGKIFALKKNLIYHAKKDVCREKDYDCTYCGTKFTSKTNMYRHMRTNCKVKKSEDVHRNSIYEKLLQIEEYNKKLEEHNKKLEEHNKRLASTARKLETTTKKLKNEIKDIKHARNVVNNVNNSVNNINNGIVANITLVGYGKEDISKMDKKDMLKVLQTGYNSAIRLTETLHFNPKYPEYHNIYITNMKDKYAMMFDGQNWTLTMKEELINKIYDDKKNFIEENLDEFIESLSASRKQALERWLDTDNNDKKIKDIKENIKLLLYNSRNLVMKNEDTRTLECEDITHPELKVIVKKTSKVIKTTKIK
jgi:hypothetical protein